MQKGATEWSSSLSRRNLNTNFKCLMKSHLVLCTHLYAKSESTSFIQQIQELQQQPQALPHLDECREQVSTSVETAVDQKALN